MDSDVMAGDSQIGSEVPFNEVSRALVWDPVYLPQTVGVDYGGQWW